MSSWSVRNEVPGLERLPALILEYRVTSSLQGQCRHTRCFVSTFQTCVGLLCWDIWRALTGGWEGAMCLLGATGAPQHEFWMKLMLSFLQDKAQMSYRSFPSCMVLWFYDVNIIEGWAAELNTKSWMKRAQLVHTDIIFLQFLRDLNYS